MRLLIVALFAFALSVTGKAATAPWDDNTMNIPGSAPVSMIIPDGTNDSNPDGEGATLIIVGPGKFDPLDIQIEPIDPSSLISPQTEPVLDIQPHGSAPLIGSIPEPTSGLLLSVGAAVLLINRRQSTASEKKS